ncbi:MAG TPA: glycosyltransferase [Chloroflexi bacterium]|nr:glycosyltransferase [Chloroflexota bacterium]
MADRSPRFLLLYSATGGGHLGAARAVAEALEERSSRVELVDVLAEYAPWPLSHAPEWYGAALRDGGCLYGVGFRLLDGRRRAYVLSALFRPWALPAACRLLAEHPADVVVAFHPVPIHTLAHALSHLRSAVPLVAVGTDLVVMHAFWADPGVSRYLVATEAARRQLLRHRIDPRRVQVVGLPVSRRFHEVRSQRPEVFRRRLGLDPEVPVVLAMAGGVGFAPLERVARALVNARLSAQIVVIAGRNRWLYERLRHLAAGGGVRVEGFVENVHEWMRAADLLVTKAGPATLAEALAVGVPPVIWGAISVQEMPNVRLVVEAKAGVWAPGPRQTVEAVRRLLNDPDARRQMRRQARRLIHPDAAAQVAEALWEAAGERVDRRRGRPTALLAKVRSSPN